MSSFNNKNIAYLEYEDITPNGNLKSYVTKGKPTIVMCQGNFCGYCTQAKPDFVKLCEQYDEHFTCATIEIDGSESEQKLGKYIPKWYKDYQGVPIYLIFGVDGIYKKTHSGSRDINSLLSALK